MKSLAQTLSKGAIMEIWKDIEQFENYQVSNLGNVRSKNYNHTGKEQVLKQNLVEGKYMYVILRNKDCVKGFRVHRLVAQAFVSNPNGFTQVNHKDENKLNNCADNLEWCDSKYNTNYGTRNAKISIKQKNHLAKSKRVCQYTNSMELVNVFPSAKEAQRQTGIYNISACCIGLKGHATAGGFVWKYEGE
jgi:hypothetical protein